MEENSETESSSSDALAAFERYEEERNRERLEVQQLIQRNKELFSEDQDSETDGEMEEHSQHEDSAPDVERVDGMYDDFYNTEPEFPTEQEANSKTNAAEEDDQMVLYAAHSKYQDDDDVKGFIADKMRALEEDFEEQAADEYLEQDVKPNLVKPKEEQEFALPELSPEDLIVLQLKNAKRRQFRVIVESKPETENIGILQKRLEKVENRQTAQKEEENRYDIAIAQAQEKFAEKWASLQPQFIEHPPVLLPHRFLQFSSVPVESADSDAETSVNTVVERCPGSFSNALIAHLSGQLRAPLACTCVLQLSIDNAMFYKLELEVVDFKYLLSLEISKTNLNNIHIDSRTVVEVILPENELVSVNIVAPSLNLLRLSQNRLISLSIEAPALQFLQIDYNTEFEGVIELHSFKFLHEMSCEETLCLPDLENAVLPYLEQLTLSSRVPIRLERFSNAYFPYLRSLALCITQESFVDGFLAQLCSLNYVFPRLQTLNFENSISVLHGAARNQLCGAFPNLQLFERESIKSETRTMGPYYNQFAWETSKKLRAIEFMPYPGRLFNYQNSDKSFEAFHKVLKDLNCYACITSPNFEPFLLFKQMYFSFFQMNCRKSSPNSLQQQMVSPQILPQLARLSALYKRRFLFTRFSLIESKAFYAAVEIVAALKIQHEYKYMCAIFVIRKATMRMRARSNAAKFVMRRLIAQRIDNVREGIERRESSLEQRREKAVLLLSIKNTEIAESKKDANIKTANLKEQLSKLDGRAFELRKLCSTIYNIERELQAAEAIFRAVRSYELLRLLERKLLLARKRISVIKRVEGAFRRALFSWKLQQALIEARNRLAKRKAADNVAEVQRTLQGFDFEDNLDLESRDDQNELNLESAPVIEENLSEFLEETLRSSAIGETGKRPTTPPVLGQIGIAVNQQDVGIVNSELPELSEKSKAVRAAELQGWNFETEQAAEAWYRAEQRIRKTKKPELSASERYKRLLEKRRE